MSIDISIIIPVYNPGELIRRCLDSILAQKGGYSYEVLLVDDGSTDNSSEIIDSYHNSAFKLMHQKNAGPAAARNRGIEAAQGKYLAFIDADDYWEDSFFETTVPFLEEHEDCVAVSVGQRHITVSGEYTVPGCLGDYVSPVVIDDFFTFWATWMHVCTGSMMGRTEVIQSTGGQRTDLRITEDLEFWALLATKGKWGFIPKVLFTSDGTKIITGKDTWLKKMQIRWNNAPIIQDWEKRIIASNPQLLANEGYLKARGQISRNLTYCHILSNREEIGRKEALIYGSYFPKDVLGKLMNCTKHTKPVWRLLSKVIQYRERNRGNFKK